MNITRKKPALIDALPRLLARLPESYERKQELNLAQQLYQIQAGYSGERKVDQYLEVFEHPKSSIILTNIHLALSPGHSFQIDTLILSKTAIIILEVKNISGDLYFDTNPYQFRNVKSNGEEISMACPITQLEVASENLRLWLSKKGFDVNICSQIVLASKNAYVKLAPPDVPVIYLKRLPIYLSEKANQQEVFPVAELRKMANVILQNRLNYSPYPLCEYYKIDPNLLKRGQLCSRCNQSMVYYNHKQRYCKNCEIPELNNHEESIQDWFLLVGNTISNRQCRSFLRLRNKDDAYYALRSVGLEKVGRSHATKYIWPKEKPIKL